MHGFNDLILECLRAAVLTGLIAFLFIRGRHSRFSRLPGAWLIMLGFSLITFGTLLDISDEIPRLERFVVIGDTPLEAFLEKIVGYLGGFLCILAGFVNVIPAIAEFEKIEQTLRESEEKFRSVFETIPDVVGITRLSDGKVIDLNPAFDELTSIPRAHLIGKSSLEMNLWADPAERERMVQEVMQHGMVRNLEARFNTGNGRVRDSLISARLLMLKGEPHLLSVYKDTTEDKQVLRALEESEEKFRSVFETIPDVVSITRLRDGLVVDLSPAIQELTGMPRENFIGRSSIEMKVWADPADRDRMVREVLSHGSIRNMEAQLNTGSGEIRDCLVSARLMTLQGEPHILTVFKDITERKNVLRALQQSEETFRKLFADSSDAILLIDSRGVFVECNQAALDLLKMTREQFLLLPPARISPEFQPDGRRSAESAPEMIALAYSKSLHRFDWTCVNAEGGEFIVEVSLMPIVIKGQTMLHTTWRDITERKRIEESLRESESRYRRLHESMSDAFAVVDEKGVIVEVNKAFEKMIGYSQEELQHLTYHDLTPEGWHAVEERLLKEQVLVRGSSEVYEKEYRCKDGRIIPVELRTFLLTDDAGQPAGMWAIVRDISRRKAVLKALQESEVRFRLIFESSPDPLIMAQGDGGGILEVNRAFVAQTGITAEQARGKTSLELDLWKDPLQRAEFLRRVLSEGGVDNMEAEFRMKDGEIRSGLTSAKLVELGGERCILIGIRDITSQKQAESTLFEMDRMKSEFISTAAHELRTPLAIIIGYTELLRAPEMFGGFSKEQCDEFLEEIYLKGETLSRIIDEMLDISRIESGHPIALALEPHDPKTWLSKVVRRFELQGSRHGFVLELPGEQPESLTCDMHRMTQVLENLLSNAVKYSPRGGTITITAGIQGNEYVVAITDEGIGMTAEQVVKVFDKFYRADASNTAIGGLGLGMSIARQIVDNHGGRIWVESTVGKGTTASFTLPLTV